MTLSSFNDPNSIEARQALLDRRCERAHPKRHRVRKRSAKLKAKDKRARVYKLSLKSKESARIRAAIHAFYRGDADEHPLA